MHRLEPARPCALAAPLVGTEEEDAMSEPTVHAAAAGTARELGL